MKKIFVALDILRIAMVFTIICFAIALNAQSVAINTTGNAADNSAMLDITSLNKGFLAPRMTTAQRTAIVTPANGLLVFDTDTRSFWFYSSSAATWVQLSTGGGGFALPYNGSGNSTGNLFSITNTNSSVIGTAIYGKKSTGSGSVLGLSAGVVGDSKFGIGVAGLCDSGYGVWASSLNNHAIYGSAYANGFAGVYGYANSMNTYGIMGEAGNFNTVGVYGKSTTLGKSALFEATDSSNADTTVLVKSVGTGVVLNVQQNNPYNFANAFSTITKGPGTALFAQSDMGIAGHFKKTNNSNNNEVLKVENATNTGAGVSVNMTNGSNLGSGISINNLGQGNGIYLALSSPANNQNMIQGYNGGTGGGIDISVTNTISTGDGLHVYNQGTGYGVYSATKKGIAGAFNSYSGNNMPTLYISNEGSTDAVEIFQTNTSNTNPAFITNNQGTGPGLLVNNTNANAVNSLATFQKNGTNKARIDGTGKGFFNGGTQNSGADLAEVFDVIGDIKEYEMGDVLVISADKDRTVEKSSVAYSTLVAGVYATKPGVLLTEENIEIDLSDKVPMGVVGVIPTKVCLEGGEIKRGDLLVTSSVSGVAMKADIEKVKPGQIIGKALENYSGNGISKIKVLVNVK